jgi:penicillin-binding protein 2
VIRNALVAVNQEGTSAAGVPRRRLCTPAGGKTGTAQVVHHQAEREIQRRGAWTSASATTPCTWRLRRPTAPKIALAMVVENAGFGGAMAAPIARRVFDYWLLGQSPTPEDMAAVQKGQAGPPPGAPRPPASAASAPASASTATPPMAAAASAVKTQPTP